ncbi:MAG: lipocalin family protein [Vitreimonas sp.]
MRCTILLVMLIVAACAPQPVNRRVDTPLPVSTIEPSRYLGLWHEAARLPNSFERNCVSATAEYGMRPDGLISVRNVCTDPNGRARDAVGRARLVGQNGEGKLKVSFFGPIWADYWVVERADDYAWSIVSEPQGRYLWLLTRAARLEPQDRALLEARMRSLGFDTSKLYWDR